MGAAIVGWAHLPFGRLGGPGPEDLITRAGREALQTPWGGLKAKGHPMGATGVSMHVVSAMQLMGEAGDLQVPGATLAGVFNSCGSAVANYASILEPAR